MRRALSPQAKPVYDYIKAHPRCTQKDLNEAFPDYDVHTMRTVMGRLQWTHLHRVGAVMIHEGRYVQWEVLE